MAGRRNNGEGTIYRRKDGRHEGAAYLLTTSGHRKRIRMYGKTRAEVHEKLVATQAQVRQGIPVPDKTWRLGAYLDYWLTNVVRPNRRAATHERSETIARLYLKPAFGAAPLSRLSVPMVQSFLNDQLAGGQSLSVVSTTRKVLSAALRCAEREELIMRNVARLAALPTYRPDKDVQPWSADEAKRFLRAAEAHPLYPAFALLVLYGLRRGEVLGLRWCDVDFANNVVHIRQQLHRVGGQLCESPLKTRASKRDLPLQESIRLVLQAHKIRQDEARALAGADWRGSGTETELVMTTGSGLPVEPRNLVRSFRRLCTRHSFRVIRVHDLRHTAATLLKDLGVPARDAQLILGHADISTTQQVYQHDSLDSRRGALGKVERLFWRAVGGGRCRQNLSQRPSTVVGLTSFFSGATLGIRTPDPRFTNSNNSSVQERLTSVHLAVNARKQQWLVGVVAVNLAVRTIE
jgi:integrase